jgi:two-component system response regulator ChvI
LPDIVIVDDDRNILTSLSIALENENWTVRTFSDPVTALEDMEEEAPDVVVLDVKMPKMDGLEVLRRLRTFCDAPVVFLTSKSGEADEFVGLRMGADDYVRKPFSRSVLVERIRMLARRGGRASPGRAEGTPEDSGRLRIDASAGSVFWDGKEVALTLTERLIVTALARRPGVVLSRDDLMDAAYAQDVFVDDRTVDSHIKRIRKKFRDVDPEFSAIGTLSGVGYRFGPT